MIPDPGRAFIDLGERLRVRGQLDAALSVAEAGVARYPGFAQAHDLVGRIRADQGDDDAARSAWIAALECDRATIGALKGLAFLAFRRQDFAEAERRLESAALEMPHDTTLLAALDRVRSARPVGDSDAIDFEDTTAGLLLFDSQGLHLAGATITAAGVARSELASAAGVGALGEADRAVRLLELGEVRHLLIEGGSHRVVVVPVEGGGVLISRPVTAPVGRVLALAERAMLAGSNWISKS